ncbi:hypothetical protein [Clostridium sp. OS1-26]|uniref:hypothetical protein n=1 Tax=Clostridium sp. OS1-26 TaxID=3070681 RepID=UPI0027DEEE0C|nr:hypothetical protein [Clostridium sp. OS1-26]WML33661.1 hypothetical protein RCG18_20275 [Clostridium sp. OS1-26]
MNRGERILKSILFVIFNIIDIYFILISIAIWIPPDYRPQRYIIENPVFIVPYLVFLYIGIALSLAILKKYFLISQNNVLIPLTAPAIFFIPIFIIDVSHRMSMLLAILGGSILILGIVVTTIKDLIRVYKFND